MLISFWKTSMGVFQPKRYPVKLECSFGTWEDCFSLLGIFKFACQYPPLKSSAVNSLHGSLPSKQRLLLINSNRKKTGFKTLFRRAPTLDPYFFFTTTRGNDKWSCNHSTIFPLIISVIAFSIICVLFWEYSLLDNDMQFLTSSSQYQSFYDECLS